MAGLATFPQLLLAHGPLLTENAEHKDERWERRMASEAARGSRRGSG